MGYDIYKLCGVAMIAALSAFLLRNIKRELEVPLSLLGSIILLGAGLAMSAPIVDHISALIGETELMADAASLLLRVIGVAAICKIASDICREMGSSGIASSLETVAKLEIIVLSIPFISSVLDTVRALFAEAGL